VDALGSNIVSACRETVKSIRSSGICQEGFKHNLIEGNKAGCFKLNGQTVQFPVIQPLLDCPTCWGSTANMIDDFRLLYIVSICALRFVEVLV
jgi:hypothetical protein